MSAYLMKMKGTSEFRIEWKMRNVLESPGGFVKMQLFFSSQRFFFCMSEVQNKVAFLARSPGMLMLLL